MTDIQKSKALQYYIAALSTVLTAMFTAFTVMVSVIYNDIRGDINDNSLEITAVKSDVSNLRLGQATTNVMVEEHTSKIKSLFDIVGHPTFRRRHD